jgi:hypothetical protein
MTTMRGFKKRITEIAVGVERNSDSLVRKTVITIASAVALRTPVDTGRARANWRTNIGGPLVAPVGTFPAGKEGSTGAAAAGQAIQDATNKMQGYTNKSGTPVFISNNLPYIDRLNKGHSKQAPAGFVESAIMAGVNAINKARLVK